MPIPMRKPFWAKFVLIHLVGGQITVIQRGVEKRSSLWLDG